MSDGYYAIGLNKIVGTQVPVTVEEASDELTCCECGKQDDTVRERACASQDEINDCEVLEVICDACEQEHIWEI